MRVATCFLLTILTFTTHSHSQEVNSQDALQSGKQADHYIAAHFATGYWCKKGNEFQCPVLGEVEQTKVAIYVKDVNSGTTATAVELDRMIQKFPQLSRSFMIVSEEGRSESMTNEELKTRLKTLQDLGEQFGIEKLSLAYLQHSNTPSRWRNSLGFFGSADMVVAVIEPGITHPAPGKSGTGRLPLRTVKPFYRFVERIHSKDIDQKSAESLIARALASLSE
jgi:hypothetical protein